MHMRSLIVLSAWLVLSVLCSCRSTRSQLSLSSIDSYQLRGARYLFDTIRISSYPFILDGAEQHAAAPGDDAPVSVPGKTVTVIRHSVLQDSVESMRSIESKGEQNNAIYHVCNTTAGSTFTLLYTLLLASLGLVILQYLLKRL